MLTTTDLIRIPAVKFDFYSSAMTPLPKRTLEWMLNVKSSYYFLTKAS